MCEVECNNAKVANSFYACRCFIREQGTNSIWRHDCVFQDPELYILRLVFADCLRLGWVEFLSGEEL